MVHAWLVFSLTIYYIHYLRCIMHTYRFWCNTLTCILILLMQHTHMHIDFTHATRTHMHIDFSHATHTHAYWFYSCNMHIHINFNMPHTLHWFMGSRRQNGTFLLVVRMFIFMYTYTTYTCIHIHPYVHCIHSCINMWSFLLLYSDCHPLVCATALCCMASSMVSLIF